MDEQERIQYESQSQTLRSDLKQWENTWAKEHSGQKPSRNDIKQNPEIAQKYKSYNQIRDILSGKIPPPSKSRPNPRKRKSTDGPTLAQTPTKRSRAAETPVKTQTYANSPTAAVAVTPSLSRRLFSPVVPTSIGPTPQRDGRVLGLFDLLSGSDVGTPSRARATDAGDADQTAAVQATPRRQTAPSSPESTRRIGRTPMSSSKRRMLDGFATPLKRHDGNARAGGSSFAARVGLGGREATTPQGPGSASRLQFATPAFLKRAAQQSLATVDENGQYLESPRPLRLPRKPLVRGLSSVVASLRKLEEEEHDDELDALREMEMESEGESGVRRPPAPKPPVERPPAGEGDDAPPAVAAGEGAVPAASDAPADVGDSQVQATNLLGGFDDEAAYDSPIEDGLDRGGRPLRVFKKKGQKRTTRLVKMKPTRTKRPVDDGGDETDEDAIPETQFEAAKTGDSDPLDLGSSSEFDGSESEDDDKETAKKAKKTTRANAKAKKTKDDGKDEGVVKRTVRKVKATAHANFKRLKLRNNGAKGGPGYNSKFRRRR